MFERCPRLCSQRTQHDPEVGSVSFRQAKALPLDGVKSWLDSVLWEKMDSMDVFRIKGVLSIAGSDNKFVVQVCCRVQACQLLLMLN